MPLCHAQRPQQVAGGGGPGLELARLVAVVPLVELLQVIVKDGGYQFPVGDAQFPVGDAQGGQMRLGAGLLVVVAVVNRYLGCSFDGAALTVRP